MTQVTNSSSLSEIMDTIDLGPTGSVQMMFAKLQLAQSEICKNQAESYMKQIDSGRAGTVRQDDRRGAQLPADGRRRKGRGAKSISGTTTSGKDCYPMSQELVDFMSERGLSFPNDDKDYILGKDEWDYNLKSLTNYQEQVGNKTQTLMVYLQDFIGQYNSYLQGANTQIANANQTLTNLARGQ